MKKAMTGPRALTTTGIALSLLGASLLIGAFLATGASATGQSLTVSPHTGLKSGQTLVVRGTGFAHGSNGAVLECNNSPGEPATVIEVHGVSHAIPVGCTTPHFTTTSRRGRLGATKVVLAEGTLGAWESGTDSAGNPAASDAASYPCPPTASESVLGITCDIEFLDNRGDVATRSLAFKTPGGKPTTTTTTTSTTTTTTTEPCDSAPVTATGNSASLTVDPGTCLVGGTVVTLTGSGFTDNSPGTYVQCNSDPDQPTVEYEGSPIPVSCSNPASKTQGPGIVETSDNGTLGPDDFTVDTGTVGPPCGPDSCTGDSATDSSGGDPFTDAASYPCPPTPAQVEAGDVCQILFGDLANDSVTVDLSFNPSV